jgi:hypothetical protein
LMHGLTNRAVSTWAFAFAYLLHFTTYGIFLFRGCVDHVWNVHKAWTMLASFWWNLPGLGQHYHHFDEISPGLGNIIIILMKSPRACATLSSFWCNLHGLGQHYHHFDAIFLLFRKLDKVSDHVTWSQRLSSCLNNKKIASKDDNVAQDVWVLLFRKHR